jgi:hypothetical protein
MWTGLSAFGTSLGRLGTLILIFVIVGITNRLTAEVRALRSASRPQGLSYPGLEYPNTGVEVVNLRRYLDTLVKREASIRHWLGENPPGEEPELSRRDRSKFWIRGSLLVCVRRIMVFSFIMTILAWAAVFIASFVVEHHDYLPSTTLVLYAPDWLRITAVGLLATTGFLLVMWLLAWMFSLEDSGGMSAWQEWSDRGADIRRQQAELRDVSDEIRQAAKVWHEYEAILRAVLQPASSAHS